MSDRVLISIADGVADVVFNRADKRNALDNAMFAAIAVAVVLAPSAAPPSESWARNSASGGGSAAVTWRT